jgi:hypothetical protein
MRIYPGSSGFWKNWLNRYTNDEFAQVYEEALAGSPVYTDLFTPSGEPLEGIVDHLDEIYDFSEESVDSAWMLIRELTSVMFNLTVSTSDNPEVRSLQINNDICLGCLLDLSELPGAAELIDAWAPCAQPGQYVVGDAVDVAEATWTGSLPSNWAFDALSDNERWLLAKILDGINNGTIVVVDTDSYPDNPTCLSVPRERPVAWFRDADADTYGDQDAIEYVCDGSLPDGHVTNADDCDDERTDINPAATEVCDAEDNDCDGVVDSGQDSDSDGVDDLCDAYPNDSFWSGPIHVDAIDGVDEIGKTVELPRLYQNPIVIVGPPSLHDPDPGVVRVSDLSSGSFDIRFQEWDYLDGTHSSGESVSYIVMEAGRHVMEDGSVWEAGKIRLWNTGRFRALSFKEEFGGIPALFLTGLTASGPRPVTFRARAIAPGGFEAAMFEEEALMDGHVVEQVGYLAVYSPLQSGEVTLGHTPVPYLLQWPRVDERPVPLLSSSVFLQEEASQNPELDHVDEVLSVLALGPHLFAQDSTSAGMDTVAIRLVPPTSDAMMEWGTVDGIDDAWTVVPLAKTYTEPVVVVKPVSMRGGDAGVIRLRDISPDSFQLRYQEWEYLDGMHQEERVFYMVVEAGTHDLGGLVVEAGKLMSGPAAEWMRIDLHAGFTDSPAVFSAVGTYRGPTAVTTRVHNRSPAGFEVRLQHEEGLSHGHISEAIGWVAIERGVGATSEGKSIEVFVTSSDDATTGESATADDKFGEPVIAPLGGASKHHAFSPTTDARFPVIVLDVGSAYDMDTCTVRYGDLTSTGVSIEIQEEQSLDDEVQHDPEEVSGFVAE